MHLSKFGEKFTRKSGILELMDDLGKANQCKNKGAMLGGGNPALIPEVQKKFREIMLDILKDKDAFENLIGLYDPPQGDIRFLNAMAGFLNKLYGWKLTEKNICTVNGSQSGFFILFNILAGEFKKGNKKILFPLVPEYIGYADQGISEDFFVGIRPKIEFIGKHTFKYHIDFVALEEYLEKHHEEVGALCVSRPTNPTGNVISDSELKKLSLIVKKYQKKLIIDNAYGHPFPAAIYTDATLLWDENIILSMSLSKVGLPSLRTGIIIADEELIAKISQINSILSLSNTRLGQALMIPMLENMQIIDLAEKTIFPFYKKKQELAHSLTAKYFDDRIPYLIHKSEGAFFLWLWFKDMPITSQELYQRLKERCVIVVSGHYFFLGTDFRQECIRINFGRDDKELEEGIRVISEELKKIYRI